MKIDLHSKREQINEESARERTENGRADLDGADLIMPQYDIEKGRYEEETGGYEYYSEETDEFKELETGTKDFETSGEETDFETEEGLKEYQEITREDGEDENEGYYENNETDGTQAQERITEIIGEKCFPGDSDEIKRTKTETIKKFVQSQDYVKTCKILQYKLDTEFESKQLCETGQDIVSKIIEGFVTGKKWDIEKYPDIKRQIFFKFKYNIRKELKNKYFGEYDKSLSQEEKERRQYKGASMRKTKNEKPDMLSIEGNEIEIDPEGGEIISRDPTSGKAKAYKMHGVAFETETEREETERKDAFNEYNCSRIEETMKKCGKAKMKKVYKTLKKLESSSKPNKQISEAMGISIKSSTRWKSKLKDHIKENNQDIKEWTWDNRKNKNNNNTE